MKFGAVPLERAQGMILAHHVVGSDGRKILRKGRPLSAEDVALLRRLGRQRVYAAEIEPGDVDEDTAARRVAFALAGERLERSKAHAGRVNLRAACRGVLKVDVERLARLNEIEGITLATLRNGSVARPRQIVATVKILPFAVPERGLATAEQLGRSGGPLLALLPLPARRVTAILSSSPGAQANVFAAFEAPLRARLEALGSVLERVEYVSDEVEDLGEGELAEALRRAVAAGAGLIVLAGETAVMDPRDVAPRALERAGGSVTCFGAPVDPGNLLLVGRLGEVPVLGAPGCARSLKPNVIDWVLPRMLAGEHPTRADVLALGHGGLLESDDHPYPLSEVSGSGQGIALEIEKNAA